MLSREIADAVRALREVILAGEYYRIKAAAHLGLSVSESQAVSYLLARGPMGQTRLAEALGFNTSSMTALIDRLERRGVVERLPDPHDRRRSNVRLCDDGPSLGDAPDWMADVFDPIPATELPDLIRTLVAIAESLRALPSDRPVQSSPDGN